MSGPGPIAILSCVGWLLSFAPAEPPSFAQLWYREVILGEVAETAEQYQSLYLSPPSSGLTQETRTKAALRAGLSFERLGRFENARLALSWIRQNGSPSAELSLQTNLSWNRLKMLPGGELESAEPRSPTPAPEAARETSLPKFFGPLRTAQVQREEAVASLGSELKLRREKLRQTSDLAERLGKEGVVLLFPERAEAASQGLKSALPREAELSRLQAGLTDRYMEKALNSVLAMDRDRSLSQLRRAAALMPGNAAAASWLRRLEAEGTLAEPTKVLAQRQLVDRDLSQRSSLRREIRDLLKNAEAVAADRGRVDLAVGFLDKIRDLLDWARPSLREDQEIRDLWRRATRLLLSLTQTGGQAEVLAKLCQGTRELVAREFALAEELVVLLEEQARFAGPATLGGRTDGLSACRAEMDRISFRAQDSLARGDVGEVERLLREGATLLAWVPGVDPLGIHGEILGSLGGEVRRILETTKPPAAKEPETTR